MTKIIKSKNKLRFFKLSYFLRKLYSLKFLSFFLNENFLRKKIFKQIYLSGYWLDYNNDINQSKSGNGSNINQTIDLRNKLKFFIKKKKIRKILDIGCGDFMFMSKLLKELDYDYYLGLDIVDSLIDYNNLKFSTKKIKFIKKDIVDDKIDFPIDFDLILVRHVFIHLKNSNIIKVLNKIKKINFKYLCITSDPKIKKNIDLKTEGRYRDINLLISPFYLNDHFQVIKVPIHEKENYVDLNVYNSKIKLGNNKTNKF